LGMYYSKCFDLPDIIGQILALAVSIIAPNPCCLLTELQYVTIWRIKCGTYVVSHLLLVAIDVSQSTVKSAECESVIAFE
jgi:hypothetical protein